MAIWVDDMFAPYRRMKMCHMIADFESELHKMAERIGVQLKWYQGDHYDISMVKRQLAIEFGATPITWRQCGMMVSNRRAGFGLTTPETAEAVFRERLAKNQLKIKEKTSS